MNTIQRPTHRRPRSYRVLPAVVVIVLLFALPVTVAGGGSRESAAEESPTTIVGEVVAVTSLPDGAQRVVVREEDGTEQTVTVPAALSRSVELRTGDTIRVEEIRRDGKDSDDGKERLFAQRIEVDRG